MKNQLEETLLIFGESLRALRKARGFSQEDFAHICSIDRTYISSLECGKRNPTLKVLATLADSLDISVSELLSGVGKKTSTKKPQKE
jgi:transcriptional regulator with XRE-family HTH domain